MATYFARKTGNINDVDVWATTPTGTAGDYFGSFTSSDILVCNSFTITINVNTTVAQIRGDNTGGATATGGFNINNGITLTAEVYATGSGAVALLSLTTANSSIVINGNIVGAAAPNGFRITGTNCVVTINGNLIGDDGTNSQVLTVGANTQNITINGNVTGGSVGGMVGISSSSTGLTINISGDVSAGSGGTSYGISLGGSNHIINIDGSVYGGSGATARGINITTASTTAIDIGGSVYGGTNTNAAGIYFTPTAGACPVNIDGDVVGGTESGSHGLYIDGATVEATIGGIAIGGSTQIGGAGASNTGAGGIIYLTGIEYGDLGASPTIGPIRLTDNLSNVALIYRYLDTKKTLIDPASYPIVDPSHVRYGTAYNLTATTGTLYMPPYESVLIGVPVDSGTGTWNLPLGGFWNTPISSINTPGSIGERLKNCATIDSVAQQLSTALNQ